MAGSRRRRGTGSVRQRGKVYQARYSYVDLDGKRQYPSGTFATKREATQWLNARHTELASHRYPSGARLTLGDFLREWLESPNVQRLQPTTVAWYRSAVERHIAPALGQVYLASLTPERIEGFLQGKARNGRLDGRGGLGSTSVRRLRVTLTKALGVAVRQGLVPSNTAKLAESPLRPSFADSASNVWTIEQTDHFLEAISSDRLAPLWTTACTTGLRRSEVCALQWQDIDFSARLISVRRARVQVDGGTPITKEPKTRASRRAIAMDLKTSQVLQRWRDTQSQEREAAGSAWLPGDWVFTNRLGQPHHPSWVSRRFSQLVKELDLTPIAMRQLRHSHATALLRQGVHPKVVQERLGHSSIRVTVDTYSSVVPSMQEEAVDRLFQSMNFGS